MRKFVGAGFIVLGILLTIFGLKSSGPPAALPVDGPTELLIGGFVSLVIGLTLAARRRKQA